MSGIVSKSIEHGEPDEARRGPRLRRHLRRGRLLHRAAGAGHHRRQRRDARRSSTASSRDSPASSGSALVGTNDIHYVTRRGRQDAGHAAVHPDRLDARRRRAACVLLRPVLHEDRRGDGRGARRATPRRSPTRSRSPSGATSSSSSAGSSCRCSTCPRQHDRGRRYLRERSASRGSKRALRRPDPPEVHRAARLRARRSSATRASPATSSSSQDFVQWAKEQRHRRRPGPRHRRRLDHRLRAAASRTSTRSSTACSSSASSTPSAPRCPISTWTSTTSAAARSSSTCATSTARTRSRRSSRSAR